MSRRKATLLIVLALVLAGTPLQAGMPAPLPTDNVVRKVLRLDESVALRLQVISFFLLGLLLSAAVVRWLWNVVQRDFPQLPRLTFGKALAGVLLWGLLFVVVLTMISGARELMTPGAWRKQGFTYKLPEEQTLSAEQSLETVRRQHLEKLRTALWHFAAMHNGRFPSSEEISTIPRELWEVPESGGMRYVYFPGRSAGHTLILLLHEPELDPEHRLVLRTNGDILSMRPEDLESPSAQGKRP